MTDERLRLASLRREIDARNGLSAGTRTARFRDSGWHATEDLPDYAEPLIHELDLGGTFKGHVRYARSSAPISGGNLYDLYDRLFVAVARDLILRYRAAPSCSLTFEADGSPSSRYERIVAAAGAGDGNPVALAVQPKGDNLLAVADYLLFATLKYIARGVQLCPDEARCPETHGAPIASALSLDPEGSFEATGHVTKADRWHRRYYAVARNMSSVVRLNIDPPTTVA
ncbi:hypothetical protein [Microbacterium sp. Clip185]|uniref:hypothetical protein n=1 Tax=Microbacterium sp. Clip185 TaxID=3025663 RepID=UPI0023652715|nr:hypothetical protein [Microbacterium sp. Clip185]WDG17468.1 hypothetical protein PQV94_12660 [Microbacterium sp. Clip185]